MKDIKLNSLEKTILLIVFLLVIIAVVSANTKIYWFENVYTVEDGFIENITILPLLVASIVSISYIKKLFKKRGKPFLLVLLLIAVFSIFVAGEEISWGQRIFEVESNDFFLQHNAQKETNLHNLVIGEKKVNKVVFSQLLVICIGIYLFLTPYFYKKNPLFAQRIDNFAIPVPQSYQVIACLLLFLSTLFIPSGKNAEILEAGITHLFLLIFLFPANHHIFKDKAKNQQKIIDNMYI